jgi:hypothetical protein
MSVGIKVSNACLGGALVNGGKGEAANWVKFFIYVGNIHFHIFPFAVSRA